jgi:tetratricopeptide (TPR) repeat protein
LVVGYTIAMLKGDRDQMDRIVAAASGRRALEHQLANTAALAHARSGRLTEARQTNRRAVDLAMREGAGEAAAGYQSARAVWEALLGNAAEARAIASAVLAGSSARDLEYAAGLALGFLGDASRPLTLADDLAARFPEDTFATYTYVPVLRALSALARHQPGEAVSRLEVALPYERAVNGLNFNNFVLGGMHSAYVRGLALMESGRHADAATEFQKLLEHRGIVGADPIGALAHVQLGRAFAWSGNVAGAKAAYKNFLALWSGADSGLPLLAQVKAEYAKLP